MEKLVECITNHVAANFIANCLLSCGYRPAMVEEPSDAEELVKYAGAVLINLGTVDERQAEAMRRAAKAARAAKVPWVLDPVGVQYLSYRRELAKELLKYKPAIIHGNAREIATLRPRGMVVLTSGKVDRIRGAKGELVEVRGGSESLQSVTATGCGLGALCAALLADGISPMVAAERASRAMKTAGSEAAKVAKGIGSFKVELVNELERGWRE